MFPRYLYGCSFIFLASLQKWYHQLTTSFNSLSILGTPQLFLYLCFLFSIYHHLTYYIFYLLICCLSSPIRMDDSLLFLLLMSPTDLPSVPKTMPSMSQANNKCLWNGWMNEWNFLSPTATSKDDRYLLMGYEWNVCNITSEIHILASLKNKSNGQRVASGNQSPYVACIQTKESKL